MNVSAKDTATGKSQSITITAATKLSKEDIDKMVKQAEQFSEDDRKRRESADLKNQSESLAYAAEKTAEELAPKIGEELKNQIIEKAKQLKEAIPAGDVAKIKELMQELTKLLNDAATKAYQQGKGGPETPGGPGAPGPSEGPGDSGGSDKGDGVVDADYRIID